MYMRIVVVFIFIVFHHSLQAQITKGATFLGGDLAFSVEKGTSSLKQDYKSGGFYLFPVYGKAIKDNVIIGVDFLYYFNNSDVVIDFNDLKQWIYGAGFFIR